MFIGEYSHKIDNKRRVAIPAKFREKIGEKAVIAKGIDNCLVLYTLESWKKEAEKLENIPNGKRAARTYARVKLASASDVKIDNTGRILIPDYLKDYANLKKKVAILGLSNRIEIWDEKTWKEFKRKNPVEDIAQGLEDLDI
ncbi:MAG: division/cell wall cluster transcriptional repressor MraZ [Minisyncoccales bacterium]